MTYEERMKTIATLTELLKVLINVGQSELKNTVRGKLLILVEDIDTGTWKKD